MKQLTVGIDIGGTNTAIGLVTSDAKILAEKSIPTASFSDFSVYVVAIKDTINELKNTLEEDYQIKGIGIGAPNANYYTGCIEYAPNLPFKGVVNLKAELGKYFDCNIVVTNDAKAATIGEMVYGGAKGMKNFAMITLGTGLGSGIIVNGQIVYGSDGMAGEFGHTTAILDGRVCGCGRKGCLETYVSATGIKRTAIELLSSMTNPSKMREISYNDLTSKMIYDFAMEGDEIALKAFDITTQILGRKLADLATIISPEAYFIFGGLANAKELIIDATQKYMEESLLKIYRGKIKVLPSALLGTNIAILGASALVV